jgi:branched-chain amino acid transport system substrate-binding protein
MQLAAELAVDEINRAGGIRGRSLELVARDDGANAEQAVQVARELYDDPTIVAVVGHLTSGATLAAAPIYNGGSQPVPAISPSASNPRVTEGGPYTFRVCPTDLVHGARLAEWAMHQLQANRAAIMYRNDDYGRGVGVVFNREFIALGGTVVASDPYLDDLASFEPYLRRIQQRGGVDVVMVAGTRPGGERILAQLAEMGLPYAVIGSDGISGIENAETSAEGVFISTAYLADRPGEINNAFVRAYRAVARGQAPDHRAAGTYDIVYLLARAIEAEGTRRANLRDYLAGVGTATEAFEGTTGNIAFDENGDVPSKEVVIGVVRDGQLVTADNQ